MALPDYYPNYDQSKRTVVKVGVITVVIITLVIICYAVFAFFFHMGKVKVEVIYAPHYAEVELNGKKVKNPSTHYLEPSEYEVRVWAPEFEEFSTKVRVDENTKYIYGSLNPATAKGEELSNDTLLDQFLEIEGIAGQVLAEESERTLEKYPILSKLPYEDSLYTLGYLINSGERDYTLTINVFVLSSLNNAVEKLKELSRGASKTLAEYRIEFTVKDSGSSPFKNFHDNPSSDPEVFLRTGFSDVGNFTIRPGKTLDNYYFTILSLDATEYNIGTTYRVVLKKNDNKWKIAGTPMPIATTENTLDVPLEILNELNDADPPKPETVPNRNYGV